MNTPCPKCPHWAEVHNADGSCGCGMNCGATPPRPTTEEGPCLAPLTDFVIDAGLCQRPKGHWGIHWFNDKADIALAAPPSDQEEPHDCRNGHDERLTMDFDGEPIRCIRCKAPAASTPVPALDWPLVWKTFANATGMGIAQESQDAIRAEYLRLSGDEGAAAPPSDQEEPPHHPQCEKPGGGFCTCQIEERAASTPVPALDVERLAEAEKWFDEEGWKAIPGFPPADPALEYEQKAAAILRRLSGDEGGDND